MTDFDHIETRAQALTKQVNTEIDKACAPASMWLWESIADMIAQRYLPEGFKYMLLLGIGVTPRIAITGYLPPVEPSIIS